MLGVHVALKPVLISEYNETFELLVVKIKIANKAIRVLTGYGPQECWDESEKTPFFNALEEEIAASELQGISTIIAMDANAKLGPTYIQGDPHKQSSNGRILAELIERHALCVVNGVKDKRKGIITREKHTVLGVEKSVIDLVIISSDLVEHMTQIHIDEERFHVLTKNVKTKTGIAYSQSDHNIINTKFKLTWCPTESKAIEVFKYNDNEGKLKFKKVTSETKHLSEIIDMKKPLDVVTNQFLRRLKGFIHECFSKVKITNHTNKELEKLYDERRILRQNKDDASKNKLEKLEEELSSKYSDIMADKILNEVKGLDNDEDGGFNTGKLWRLKKKLCPRANEPPAAMQSDKGKLLTSDKDILDEAIKHYKKVFKPREMNPEMKYIENGRERLCQERLSTARQNKTPAWTTDDVKLVLKQLKLGKSKDPYKMPNEIFKHDVAGHDLILAITKLMNRMKDELLFPVPMNVCNVTNLFKNKGSKQHFDNYRGIFRTPVLRNILDKLIYNDEYETVDQNLTNCNVGSRKRRNIRDNLFVINAIANSSKQNTNDATDINVYDVMKCFDSLWLSECINDLYETGLKNDKLVLLYESNQSANIAVKTSSGETERFIINKTVMQGTVWSGLMCTVTMDKLCKLMLQNEHLMYKYRNKVNVPPLQMVDDIISAVRCGSTATAVNAIINAFIESKKLKLGNKKCAKIHIGSKASIQMCPEQSIHGEHLKCSEKEKYLGDFVSKYGNSKETIKDRKSRGNAILSNMKAILRDIPLGCRRTQIGIVLRKSLFMNGCLYNSEVWTGFSDNDLHDLQIIDHQILRLITGSQSKVPVEMLYLETSQVPIIDVISVRRLLYLHEILRRPENELIVQIYTAMKESPLKDDWIYLIYKDMKKFDICLSDESISLLTKQEFKKIVKSKMRKYVFTVLESIKQGHSKVRDIQHYGLKYPQPFLTSALFNNKQTSLLFNLRSSCVNEFKANFFPSTCPLCCLNSDTQEHAIVCLSMRNLIAHEHVALLNSVTYCDIFSDIEKQFKITQAFELIIRTREKLRAPPSVPAYPGLSTGPAGD